ncbi:MAG: ATP-binding protein [Desulfobulbaceae bacterium]|nr:ATP-binding protein [Desulfobulbaceae bacterium]
MERNVDCAEFSKICALIEEKKKDYSRYSFSHGQNNLQCVFSDLAQELDTIQDFYRLCVAAPGQCMGLDCSLYLVDVESGVLQLVCDSKNGLSSTIEPMPEYLHSADEPYEADGFTVLPVYFPKHNVLGSESSAEDEFLGLFVVTATGIDESELFFLGKYVNRIGVNLHNRLLILQNIRHLKFINGLVMDIEHNVIVPNMYFRHLFNNLKKSVAEIAGIEDALLAFRANTEASCDTECAGILERVGHLHQQLDKQHRELREHHSNTSLFLESLFRRDHFVQGHLVLRPRYCQVEKEIISPQLDHFASRFEARGITVEPPVDMAEEDLLLVVDVGLLSQVYANFFSNALKYVDEIKDHSGHLRKAVTYGRELVTDFFGPSRHGIKLNVFTTGPHLSPEVAENVYKEGFRGESFSNQPGSGHGLSFVKQVIEIHGGVVGYEPTEEGNNFYFVLPRPTVDAALSVIVGPPGLP